MTSFPKTLHWIACALVFLGALAACTTSPTPIALATSTLIPATVTNTPSPIGPSPSPLPSLTPFLVATASIDTLQPILPVSITPDANLSNRIVEDLATQLEISLNRIQIVSIDADDFSERTLDCMTTTGDYMGEPFPHRSVSGYRYILLVGNILYEYHSAGVDRFMRCPSQKPLANDLLIQLDPIAADTVRVVQEVLAEELDISSRRIQLISIQGVIWQDTSLGCPREGQSYHPAQLVGYRVVVSAGDTEYIYHSDSIRVYPCDAGNEVLP